MRCGVRRLPKSMPPHRCRDPAAVSSNSLLPEASAGGAHHTAFTYDLTAEQMGDWANAMGIEAVYIDKDTKIREFKKDLMLGNLFYR